MANNDWKIRGRMEARRDWAWFRGHFPGDPILPGIAEIEMVLDLLEKHLGRPVRLRRLGRIKFKKIVRPGETLDIQAGGGNKENVYGFRIVSAGEEVCSGMITLAPPATTSEPL